MEKNSNYKIRLAEIEIFGFDVDGVISDGTIQLDGEGEWVRNMHVRDGLAMKMALEKGYKIVIITAGTSQKVRERMNYLGIQDVHMGVTNKLSVLQTYVKSNGLKMTNVLYMGDDLPDYECIVNSGVGTCPNDAVREIREVSDYVSHVEGGKGAVREVIEQVMRLKGDWPLF
jgi:3-deoxy-D-manno-octulosonate 8-phosphate phosphatase (KDO 8-P phosphatase)